MSCQWQLYLYILFCGMVYDIVEVKRNAYVDKLKNNSSIGVTLCVIEVILLSILGVLKIKKEL